MPVKKILICHASSASWKSWSIPKGLPEKNEDAFDAAARELLEETGIDLNDMKVLEVHALPSVAYKKQKKKLVPFLVIAETNLEGFGFHCEGITKKGVPEIDAWKWVSLKQAADWLHETQVAGLALVKELVQEL